MASFYILPTPLHTYTQNHTQALYGSIFEECALEPVPSNILLLPEITMAIFIIFIEKKTATMLRTTPEVTEITSGRSEITKLDISINKPQSIHMFVRLTGKSCLL